MAHSSGIWNETESWSLMFKGANTIGCLPRLDGVSPMSTFRAVYATSTFEYFIAAVMASRRHCRPYHRRDRNTETTRQGRCLSRLEP